MKTGARWLAGVAIALTLSPGCRGCRQSAAEEAAETTARLSTTKEQAQLWQEAADKGSPGLERVPIAQEPVQERRPSPPVTSTPVPAQRIVIPLGVVNAIRVVEFPANPLTSYEGPATVMSTSGDEIRLDLGSKRFLTILARAGKNPIKVVKDEVVTVAYASRIDPLFQDVVIGIRTSGGTGIVEVVRAGPKPVEAKIPLFNFSAMQIGTEPTSPVRVSGPNLVQREIKPGEMLDVGSYTIFIVGSAGVEKGADPAQVDETPYALNVLVWKVP
ncbi:MAG TPA: hypothetical protein VM846_16185 [Vicinamibacterales bacterium]|nr:hypothetical protein [Vicinamibacterales bacterium]